MFNLDDFFFQIFPSAIVSSLRMTLFKSLEGQKQQKQHSQARSRKRGACEVGNCFNIQIPGVRIVLEAFELFRKERLYLLLHMDRVDVTSSTLYHHQPKSLFTIYITSAITLVRSPNLLIIMSFFYSTQIR